MIKLKSLFRRGQGGPSGSSKHSHNAVTRNKSQSTTSINSAVENEQSQLQQQQQQQQQHYIPIGSERGVDVGDDPFISGQLSATTTTTNTLQLQKSTEAINTHKQRSSTAGGGGVFGKKGHKQPKHTPNITDQAKNVHGADIMSADALGPSNQYPYLQFDGDQFNQQHKLSRQAQQSSQFVGNEQLYELSNKMQELQTELEHIGKEKLLLESRVAELLPYQSEVSKLRSEIVKMQSIQEKNQLEIANLKYENESLRSHLHDVVNSPLSDAEKHQIIQDSQRLHSSAPASIALPSLADANDAVTSGVSGGSGIVNNTNTPCLTPDWDKHSSSSEVSVACLQDKIIQMEETHYSTNEELQATLQELADLQSQLSDAQTENERLVEEKDVLFQSLCRQTEKLNEARQQVTTLQELLLRDTKQAEISTSEREQKLLDLIKTAQEEREAILVKQEELNAELNELKQFVDNSKQETKRLRERIAVLESTLDAVTAERKQMEVQLQQAREEISQRTIEITRLSTLLENARSKIDELEQELARGEKSDVSDLLDAARKEKDMLEEQAAELQDQLSRAQAETRRFKEQLSALTEECKVVKNNAKCALSHLEYRLEQLQQEKDNLSAEHQQLVDSTAELQVQCKCHLEDKTQLQNLLSETQTHLGDVERKFSETKEQLESERQLRKQECEEWQQFQSDLLMTVRVANDFKTEALSEREQLVLDNKTQKEKIRLLEQQIEKLTKQQVKQNETQQSVLSTVQQEMASRRNSKISNTNSSNFSRQDSRLSVKTLVESIENNKQVAKTEENTEQTQLCNTVAATTTNTTNNANNSELSNNLQQNVAHPKANNNEWTDNVRLSTGNLITGGNTNIATSMPSVTTSTTTVTATSFNTKGPLREQQQKQQQTNVSSLHISNLSAANLSKSPLSGERKDPLNMLAKNGGSKRNALLKWCQNKTVGYRNIDITNFSSSWNDGLAFCAILHSYLPDRIPYDTLSPANKRRNFSLAFAAAESVGIPTTLNINDMCQIERPDWTQVMTYVTSIYKHFET